MRTAQSPYCFSSFALELCNKKLCAFSYVILIAVISATDRTIPKSVMNVRFLFFLSCLTASLAVIIRTSPRLPFLLFSGLSLTVSFYHPHNHHNNPMWHDSDFFGADGDNSVTDYLEYLKCALFDAYISICEIIIVKPSEKRAQGKPGKIPRTFPLFFLSVYIKLISSNRRTQHLRPFTWFRALHRQTVARSLLCIPALLWPTRMISFSNA